MFHFAFRGVVAAFVLTLGLFAAGCDSGLSADPSSADAPAAQKSSAVTAPASSLIESISLLGSGQHLAGQTRTYQFDGINASTNWTLLNNFAAATKGSGYFSGDGYPLVDVSVPAYVGNCGGSFKLRYTKTNGTPVTTTVVIPGNPNVC